MATPDALRYGALQGGPFVGNVLDPAITSMHSIVTGHTDNGH